MAYCTEADIQDRIGEDRLLQLADFDDDDAVDSDQVTNAIADADDIIDGYLRSGGYSTPLTTVPGTVKGWSIDIAIYTLSRRLAVEDAKLRKWYDDAIAMLRSVASKKFILPGVAMPTEATTTGSGPRANTVGTSALQSELANYFEVKDTTGE